MKHVLKNVNPRRLLQIAMIYGFALVAAVACGENFALKKRNSNVIKPNVSGQASTFRPQNIAVTRTPLGGRDDRGTSSYSIDYSIVDGNAQAFQISTYHPAESTEQVKNSTNQGVKYSLVERCDTAECTNIYVIVSRVMPNGQAEQMTFIAAGAATAYQMVVNNVQYGTMAE